MPRGPAMDALEYPHFPARFQAVLWRNWGLVPLERLAAILQTECTTLEAEGAALGLPPYPPVNPLWISSGYMTLLRKNWHLLSYDQLAHLLGWSEEEFRYRLKEDDALWSKLGHCKPKGSLIQWEPLTPDQQQATEALRQEIRRLFPEPPQEVAFAFFQELEKAPALAPPLAPAPPQPASEEVCRLDGKLCFQLPEDPPEDLLLFIRRYRQRWERPDSERRSGPKLTLTLSLTPNPHLKAESHTINIARDEITMDAVDARGILRALQWIDATMRSRGTATLPTGFHRRETQCELRLIYPYHFPYGEPLLHHDTLPEGLLAAYSEAGINAIWLHVVLSSLHTSDDFPGLGSGQEQRLQHLEAMVEQAAGYGIDLFLFFNEPRALPLKAFEQRPDWAGIHLTRTGEEMATLCTSHPGVLAYLEEATAALFRRIPRLGGLLTITMGEHPTNCYSAGIARGRRCPRCGPREPVEIVAEVNNAFWRGMQREQPNARLLVWTWAMRNLLGETLFSLPERLPPGTFLLSTSEDGKTIEVAGKTYGPINDYSISQVGPSGWSRRLWQSARSAQLKTAAKLQVNNSWELSAIPSLPVYDLVEEHLENLQADTPDALMLSWSLGGYPSLTLHFLQSYYWKSDDTDRLNTFLETQFPQAQNVCEALQWLGKGFRAFPFHQCVAYHAPLHYGPMNLLFERPLLYKCSMVGFPQDDLGNWRAEYSEHEFERQLARLCRDWGRGVTLLKEALNASPAPLLEKIHLHAEVALLHFASTLEQVRYLRWRNRLLTMPTNISFATVRHTYKVLHRLRRSLRREIEHARRLEALLPRDATIGFESSNHYYYTWHDLREKVLNLHHLLARYQERFQLLPPYTPANTAKAL